MRNKIHDSENQLLNLGFIKNIGIIQTSYSYVLEDISDFCEITKTDFIHYKSLSLSLCNDKGLLEYYVFVREGYTNKRHDDHIITISRNYLYVDEVVKLLSCFKK